MEAEMVTAFVDAMRARAIGVVVAALCCANAGAPAAAQDMTTPPPASAPAGPWFVRITPYAWLPSVSGSTRDRGRGDRSVPSLSIDKGFSDILGDLDFAGMIVGTVRYERIGLLVDLDYISLTVDGNLPGRFRTRYHTNLEAVLSTVGVTARVVDEPKLGVDLLVGARILGLWVDSDFKGQGRFGLSRGFSDSATIVDGLVGVRASVELGDGFSLLGYADIGAGNSDLTWQVLGAVEYSFSNSVSGAIGYRYLGYDFGGHAPLDDLALYGPILGVTFRF
jgi:opacity protein-like surface antigen